MSVSYKTDVVKYTENFAVNLSNDDAKKCGGYIAENNTLKGLYACEQCDARRKFKGIMGQYDDGILVFTDQLMQKYNGEFKTLVTNTTASDDLYGAVSRDRFYVTYKNQGLWTGNMNFATHCIVKENLMSIAVANERLIVLHDNGSKVWFGKYGEHYLYMREDVQSDYVTLPTPCDALISVSSNAVYALGKTCYKITFGADLTDIKVEKTAQGLGNVLARTVCALENTIVFATSNGLCRLDNGKVKRILNGFEISDGITYRAKVWRGYYVLLSRRNDGSTAYVFDVGKETCAGVLYDNLADIYQSDGCSFTVFCDGSFCRENKTEFYPARFIRSQIDFGTNACKFLRRLNVKTKCGVDVYITDNECKRRYFVKGSKNMQSIPLTGKGCEFTVEIRSQGETEITCFELTAETYKEDYYGN